MKTLGIPPSGPLLSIQKAALVLVGSGVLVAALDRLALNLGFETNRSWYESVVDVYLVGHMLLAIVVILKGRLRVRFPIDQSWLDVLVVVVAPWVGPIVWYREWKKAHPKMQK